MFGVNPKPRGRWAQKASLDQDAIELLPAAAAATIPTPIPVIPLAANHHLQNQTSDYNSASSKDVYQPTLTHHNTYLSEDSSIDSGMEGRRELLIKHVHIHFNTILCVDIY